MPRYTTFLEDFVSFIKEESLYRWLIIFIISINLMAFYSGLDKGVPSAGESQKPSRVGSIIEKDIMSKASEEEKKKAAFTAAFFILAIAGVILIGLIISFIMFVHRIHPHKILEKCHSPTHARWDIWDVLKVVILFIFFGYIITLIEYILSAVFPAIKLNERIVSIINTSILDILVMALVLYFVISWHKHKLSDLGLTLKNFAKNITYGFVGYISITPALVAALLITVFFVGLFRYKPEPQPILDMFLKEDKKMVLTYLTFFVAIIGPVVEEIFFRGFLYRAVKKEVGMKWAILTSGLIFSFLHAHIVAFLPIFVLGVFLAYLYEKTGSIISSITVHITHNLAMLSLILFIKNVGIH